MSNENPNIPDPKPGTKDALKAENEALNAENEALRAELEALKTRPVAASGVCKNDASVEERVEIFVPRVSGNTDPNLLIVLNGKNYVLPRGKKSLVPKAVAAEYERTKQAQYKVDNAIADMVEQARLQAAAAGIKE